MYIQLNIHFVILIIIDIHNSQAGLALYKTATDLSHTRKVPVSIDVLLGIFISRNHSVLLFNHTLSFIIYLNFQNYIRAHKEPSFWYVGHRLFNYVTHEKLKL